MARREAQPALVVLEDGEAICLGFPRKRRSDGATERRREMQRRLLHFPCVASASAASGVIAKPSAANRPSIRSLSTRFFGQPRLTNATVSIARGAVVVGFFLGGLACCVAMGRTPTNGCAGTEPRIITRRSG